MKTPRWIPIRRFVSLSPLFLAPSMTSCRIGPELRELPLSPPIMVDIASSDPVLREVLCERLNCRNAPSPAPGRAPAPDDVPQLTVEISLRDSSADLLRNNLTSLATLTTAAFVTHSVDVDYVIRSGTGTPEQAGTMRIRHGMWAVLPVYMGLAATNLGSALNTYRDPVDLQRYCLLEEPGSARRWVHGDRGRMCLEYRDFLRSLATRLEPQLQAVFISHSPSFPTGRHTP